MVCYRLVLLRRSICCVLLTRPDRIAKNSGELRYQLANGQRADLMFDHPCQGKSGWWQSHCNKRNIRFTFYTAESLDIVTLQSMQPQLFREATHLGWDSKAERVRAEKTSLPGCRCAETSATHRSECRAKNTMSAGRDPFTWSGVFTWNEESEQWLQRWRCAADWLRNSIACG